MYTIFLCLQICYFLFFILIVSWKELSNYMGNSSVYFCHHEFINVNFIFQACCNF